MNKQTVTKGHDSIQGGLRGHSIGEIYPLMVIAKGHAPTLWHVMDNTGKELSSGFSTSKAAHEQAKSILGKDKPSMIIFALNQAIPSRFEHENVKTLICSNAIQCEGVYKGESEVSYCISSEVADMGELRNQLHSHAQECILSVDAATNASHLLMKEHDYMLHVDSPFLGFMCEVSKEVAERKEGYTITPEGKYLACMN